jgi:hypothetical protein
MLTVERQVMVKLRSISSSAGELEIKRRWWDRPVHGWSSDREGSLRSRCRKVGTLGIQQSCGTPFGLLTRLRRRVVRALRERDVSYILYEAIITTHAVG